MTVISADEHDDAPRTAEPASVGGAGASSRVGAAIRRLLAGRWMPVTGAALALLLTAPSLRLGLIADDHVLEARLRRPPLEQLEPRSPFDVFIFVSGDPDEVHGLVESGGLPWWTAPDLRLAFFRPLTGLTHWLDFRLWPVRPWLMHLQSLVWFTLTVAVAAVLYRRLIETGWVAGLAGLLFAVDDAHGLPAMWLANRNATVATLFGLLGVLVHDRWRREGWRPGLWIGPVCLLAALGSGETALGAFAFLVAHVLTLDPARGWRRAAALLPALTALLVWAAAYLGGGFGAAHSGVYVDPVTDPLRFLGAVTGRAPFLLFGQVALPSFLPMLLSPGATAGLWLLTVAGLLALAVALRPLLQRSPEARFSALGTVLAVIPICATFPDDRLLFLAGFGGSGVVALVIAGAVDRAGWIPTRSAPRAAFRGLAAVAVLLHLVLAPLALAGTVARLASFDRSIERAASSLPSGEEVANRTVVVVTTPSAFVASYAPLVQLLGGRSIAGSGLVLGSGIHPTTVHRPAADVLVVRPEGGFLAPPGTSASGRSRTFDPRFFYQALDLLYRDRSPFPPGWSVEIGGASLAVTALTPDGRPAELTCRFASALEDRSLCWLSWQDGVWVPFRPPPVGAVAVLPAVTIPL